VNGLGVDTSATDRQTDRHSDSRYHA